ncbi:MAG: extracellular solute-binding protein [Oscillospiraceae bacterium]|nr:extracellular solute-binding protein [Oscillospiraceae bacterium]
MKQTTKRILALVLALVMVAALAACAPNAENQTAGEAPWGEDGKPFTPETEIKITVSSHASWPYDENWVYWKYLVEGSGATVDVDAIVGSDYNTKINLMIADSATLPDLLEMGTKSLVDQHAASGAFIAIDDHLDEMPNYTKALESYDPEIRAGLERERKSADGKIYQPIVLGTSTVYGAQGWMYRRDIFEKHGLEVPETLDDMKAVAIELKKLYPNSYPITLQGGMGAITILGPAFKPYMDYGPYYDFTTEEWKYGAQQDEMKELIRWMLMMADEGLLQPQIYGIDGASYDEYMTSDKTFITAHYLVRKSVYNVPMKQTNPEYDLAEMVPARANIPTGQNKMPKTSVITGGLTVPNTKKPDRIANAIRFLDYMYADSTKELMSWGKEGETYRVNEAGEKEFILEPGETVQLKYGMATSGLLQRVDELAYNEALASGSPIDPAIFEYAEDNVNPHRWLSFNDEEMAIFNQYYDAVFNYTCEMIDKFVLRTEPLTDENWEKGQARLKELGVEEILKIYRSAWERVK